MSELSFLSLDITSNESYLDALSYSDLTDNMAWETLDSYEEMLEKEINIEPMTNVQTSDDSLESYHSISPTKQEDEDVSKMSTSPMEKCSEKIVLDSAPEMMQTDAKPKDILRNLHVCLHSSCHKYFDSQYQLESHFFESHNKDVYLCKSIGCNTSFMNFQDFKNHSKWHNRVKKLLRLRDSLNVLTY